MANKFRGVKWNNSSFGAKMRVRRSIDLAELGDFGSITADAIDLPTGGALHRAVTGGSTSGTRSYVNLSTIHDNAVVDNQDMGLISDATTTHRIWSSMGAVTDVSSTAPTTLGNATPSNDSYQTVDNATGTHLITLADDVSSYFTSSMSHCFNGDGTKFYLAGSDGTNNIINTYTVGTAYDITSLTYSSQTTGLNPDGMGFNDDGTIFYVTNGSGGVAGFELTTAYTLPSTLAISGADSSVSAPNLTSYESWFWKTDGTKFYGVMAGYTYKVVEYDLTTAWDLDTASASGEEYVFQNESIQMQGAAVNSTGTKFYLAANLNGDADEGIFEYSMSTAWDLSTASYNSKFLSTSDDNMEYPTFLTINHDDSTLYMQSMYRVNGTQVGQAIWKYEMPVDSSSSSSSSSSSTSSTPWYDGMTPATIAWGTTTTYTTAISNPGYYAPNNWDSSDEFGEKLAMTNDYVVVGMPKEDGPKDSSDTSSGNFNSSVGAAIVYDPADGSKLYELDNPNEMGWSKSDQFGYSVAVDGDYCVVTAPYDTLLNQTTTFDMDRKSGTAYVFDLTDGSLKTTYRPSDSGHGTVDTGSGVMGFTCAISGQYVAVSHHEGGTANNSPATGSGFVTIFHRDTGAFIREIQNPYPQRYDYFASGAMAMSGDKLVVGSPNDGDVTTTDGSDVSYSGSTWKSGSVMVFDVTDGSLLHTIDNPNTTGNAKWDSFGNAVAIEGDKLVVGARYEGQSSNFNSSNGDNIDESKGAVYFFDLSSNTPTTATYTKLGAQGDRLGTSVAISGNYVVAGAPGHNAPNDGTIATHQGDGEVKIYQFSDGSLKKTFDNPNVVSTDSGLPGGDVFGEAVAIDGYTSGGIVMVGAPREEATRTVSGVTIGDNDGMLYKYVGS